MIIRPAPASTALALVVALTVPGHTLAGGSHATASDASGCPPAPTSSPGLVAQAPSPAPIASGCPSVDASPPLTAPGAMTVTVEAGDLYFSPARITVPAVGETRLVLADRGRVVHNLTVDELAIQLVVSPGGSAEAEGVDPPPGTYEFYCSVSGHREAGMVGALTVG